MKKTKFYICPVCRNTVEMVYDTDIALFCCGEKMVELIPNTVEASGDKHIPVATVKGNVVEVNVGVADHPMAEVHWIQWVQLITDKGSYRKTLNPGEEPHVTFQLNGEKAVAVYAYCNLHGLWKTELGG
jgi:superoxide reductase